MSALEQVIPDGYKQTDVGVIPNDWNAKTFGQVMQIRHGKDQKAVQVSDGRYPIFGTGGKMGETNTALYDKPSVLIGRKGTINKPRFIDTPFWTVDTLFYSEVSKKESAKFIYYKFCMIDWMQYNEASGVPSLNASTIESVVASFPETSEEQAAIANALSDVDALLTELEKLIAKKQAIKTATMQQLLTGKTRLPQFATYSEGEKQGQPKGTKSSELGEIPEDWDVSNIGSVLSITTGSRNTQDKLSDGQYPFFVRSQTIERINTYSFDGEAVLTAGDGVGTGKIFHYMNGKFDYHQRVYLMYNFGDRIDGYYFYIYFSNFFYDRIMSMTAKSSVDSVRREMIADMLITLPSKEEQTAIATILSDMDNEIQTLEKRLAKTRQIKQGMMQQLLTGRTRLPFDSAPKGDFENAFEGKQEVENAN
ncbi:restriction endonuclease subunit S [Pseudocolwellia agarivorans]|uniref:restriction endonuclease subunit S n=1 Tax=Pseudocolwellia agarivorans TaxID=1911682 RepID=UPI0009871130|nr:restriction endonuclease subunit S [Pseudocolwellia agarivorans]